MNSLSPAIAGLLFHGSSGEIQPDLISVSAALVGSGYPNHHRRSISHVAETRFAFLNGLLRGHPLRDVTRGDQQTFLSANNHSLTGGQQQTEGATLGAEFGFPVDHGSPVFHFRNESLS